MKKKEKIIKFSKFNRIKNNNINDDDSYFSKKNYLKIFKFGYSFLWTYLRYIF